MCPPSYPNVNGDFCTWDTGCTVIHCMDCFVVTRALKPIKVSFAYKESGECFFNVSLTVNVS